MEVNGSEWNKKMKLFYDLSLKFQHLIALCFGTRSW